MKHVLNTIARCFICFVFLCISSLSLILTLCYYQEPEAILPGIVCAIFFFLSLACFIDE